MHASIGILLALPWFSLMMILGDMIFIRDRTWDRATAWVRARWERMRGGARTPAQEEAQPTTDPDRVSGTPVAVAYSRE